MLRIDLLDLGVYADGKHVADFEDYDDDCDYALELVEDERASSAVVVDNSTGEVKYTADEVIVVKAERKVVEGN